MLNIKNSTGRFLLLFILILLTASRSAEGAASNRLIRSVKVRLGVDYFDELKRPVITADTEDSSYEVIDVKLNGESQASGPAAALKPPEEKLQSPPTCEIELASQDEKKFAVMKQEDIRLTGIEGSCIRAVRRQAKTALVLTVELTGLKNIIGEISAAYLDPSGLAGWEEAANAPMYQVQLYRDGEKAGLFHRTEKPVFDFSPLMIDGGVYSYQVTPVTAKGKKGKLQESARIRLSGRQAEKNREDRERSLENPPPEQPTGRRQTGRQPTGWQQEQNSLRYRYQDGLYPQNTWLELDGVRYYFDGNGIMTERREAN